MLAQLLLTSSLVALPAGERHAEFLAGLKAGEASAQSGTRLAQSSPGGMPPAVRPPMMDRGPPGPPYLRGLELTDAQQDQVFAILHAQMPAVRERMREAQRARVQLHDLARSAGFDDATARMLADTIARATAELELLRARSDAQIWQVLTPEQRRQAAEMPPRPPHDGPESHGHDPRGPR